jgi:hypothetical protein
LASAATAAVLLSHDGAVLISAARSRLLCLSAVIVLGAVPSTAHAARDTTSAALELTADAIGGIAVGGSGRAAEKRLRKILGPPDRAVTGGGCELDADAEPRRTLTWGALAVSMTPVGSGDRLVGWTIGTGSIPAGVRLPHGVSTRTTVKEAMRRIPGATARWDEVFQMRWITTAAEPAMMWAGDHEDGSGRITYITNAFEPCE